MLKQTHHHNSMKILNLRKTQNLKIFLINRLSSHWINVDAIQARLHPIEGPLIHVSGTIDGHNKCPFPVNQRRTTLELKKSNYDEEF